jgi:hypothetical protein
MSRQSPSVRRPLGSRCLVNSLTDKWYLPKFLDAAPTTPDFGAVYYLRFYENGKERKQKVGRVDLLPKAKVLLERRLFAKANGFLLPEAESAPEAAERKTLAQAIDQYVAFQRTRRIKGVLRSAKDVEGIRNSLMKFQKSCGKYFFDDVDKKDLRGFIDQLETRWRWNRTL